MWKKIFSGYNQNNLYDFLPPLGFGFFLLDIEDERLKDNIAIHD